MKNIIMVLFLSIIVNAQTENKIPDAFQRQIDEAVDHYNVSLFDDSKKIFLELLYSTEGKEYEAEIRYHLGILSFYEGEINNAFLQWKKMSSKFPTHTRSKEISRITSSYLRSEEGEEIFREEELEYSQDLKQVLLFWTPIYPNRKLFWGELKDPGEAYKIYKRFSEKYDDPKKKFIFTYYRFRLLAGFNNDNYGFKNETGSYRSDDPRNNRSKVRQNAIKFECGELLKTLEGLSPDETDLNYNLLVQANYLWAIRLSGSELFSGKVKVNKESKEYFNKVIELTRNTPNNIYRTFSQHWLGK
ncbi:MAG: hypothetical protein HOK52_06850 [Candidatus Marinimicrobia bacterium]|jgi:hypothetical protein|nr:hypothetical protein [Candidatus Neomarinimicrobiota bacterium]MBT6470964.1 hypothetical protein [Candidatus Neomarinimicrobiota bacterium]MBT6937873.1 hypothetical protein [Candidatus Neomarinimicrobiota bacterium]